MVFNSSERVLPPIMTLGTSSQISENATTVLPPVSCLAPEMSSLSHTADFSNPPHEVNRMSSSSMRVPGSYIYSSPATTSSYPSTASSSEWKFILASASQITMTAPPQIPPQLPSQMPSQMTSQMTSQMPSQMSSQMPSQMPSQIPSSRSNDRHNLITKPIHSYHSYIDPASELLAEKRRRNAGASARFRDRRKQREREMKDKCQFLERRVQELEKELEEHKNSSQTKILELERNNQKLHSKLCSKEEVEFLTPPPSAVGDDFEHSFRKSRSSSTISMPSTECPRKSIDVKSLLL
ncbi:hypothetical protein Glove_216g202 [Diversispora epigaea]|uniref:BZIP domain-containing protein n=1 Tax=Diversispora epigaea TaxID=1348612 RepID=A0A397IKB9_9GLOM|nr:hypothetical protein Glove_216g202 [Diversispora epigaea]